MLRGESLRSIVMDWNERGVKTVGSGKWQGSMIRRVLMSPRIAGLKEHRGEIVGEATWPAIIDRATHDRLVGLLGNPERRPANYGRPRVHPLAGLLYCGSCGGPRTYFDGPKPPFTPGYELVGVIEELGAGCSRLREGDHVGALTVWGSNAERVCVPEKYAVEVPEDLDPAEVVSLIFPA